MGTDLVTPTIQQDALNLNFWIAEVDEETYLNARGFQIVETLRLTLSHNLLSTGGHFRLAGTLPGLAYCSAMCLQAPRVTFCHDEVTTRCKEGMAKHVTGRY